MILFDYDDKLLVADNKQLRLWDFYDQQGVMPAMISMLESPLKIEKVKVNKYAELSGDRKFVYYYAITCQDEFKVYHGRLELLISGNVGDKITSIEFGVKTKNIYFGTSKGTVIKYELPPPLPEATVAK